jgi:hypothetical protein
MRTLSRVALVPVLVVASWVARGDDAPVIEHQPSPCTLADQPISLCAFVADDGKVAKARVFFRPTGEKYFSFVEMEFGGINFCGTLPAPAGSKLRSFEYYVQAVDDQYQAHRTSTFEVVLQPEANCGFPPLEKDPGKAANITVYASHPKQGKKLPGGFVATGVKFVPVNPK